MNTALKGTDAYLLFLVHNEEGMFFEDNPQIILGNLEALALRGEPMGGHTSRLLKLLDRYGATDLDAALAEALARGAISAASVAHVLDQQARLRGQAPPLDVVLPDDPRVRELRVQPHALAPYDELSTDFEVPPTEEISNDFTE